jgi:hypothetical protein
MLGASVLVEILRRAEEQPAQLPQPAGLEARVRQVANPYREVQSLVHEVDISRVVAARFTS